MICWNDGLNEIEEVWNSLVKKLLIEVTELTDFFVVYRIYEIQNKSLKTELWLLIMKINDELL